MNHRQRPGARQTSGPWNGGFTIVELLVVISVIALLVAILLPALSGAQRRSKKSRESNQIRQLGIAFNLYAQANKDSAVAGYVSPEVGPGGQSVIDEWKLNPLLPDETDVMPEDGATWVWRLMSYLSYDHDAILGYSDLEETSQLAMTYTFSDPPHQYPGGRPVRPAIPRPSHIAQEPAFAYNSFYVGGWWDEWLEVEAPDGTTAYYRPNHRFANTTKINRATGMPEGNAINVVAKSPSSIQNSSRVILFCPASTYLPGETTDSPRDDRPGCHVVVPHFLGETDMWSQDSASPDFLTANGALFDIADGWPAHLHNTTSVPIGRHTGQAVPLYADLHVESVAPGDLDDSRLWIDHADDEFFFHQD